MFLVYQKKIQQLCKDFSMKIIIYYICNYLYIIVTLNTIILILQNTSLYYVYELALYVSIIYHFFAVVTMSFLY